MRKAIFNLIDRCQRFIARAKNVHSFTRSTANWSLYSASSCTDDVLNAKKFYNKTIN